MENETISAQTVSEWTRKKVPIWGTIGEALGFAAKNYQLFFLIMLAGFAIQAANIFIPSTKNLLINIIIILMALAGLFMSLWSNVAIITAMDGRYNKHDIKFKESFAASLGKIWQFVINSIVKFFITIFGALLLVIPGLYFGIIYGFVPIAVVVEDHRFISPFRMSAALVKHYFWMVVGYGLAMFAVMVPVIIACATPAVYFVMKDPEAAKNLKTNPLMPFILVAIYLADAAILPFIHSMNYLLYAKLKEAKEGSKELSSLEALKPKMNGCLIAVLFVILTLVLTLIFYFLFRGIVPHK
jgi:hypothetical protein